MNAQDAIIIQYCTLETGATDVDGRLAELCYFQSQLSYHTLKSLNWKRSYSHIETKKALPVQGCIEKGMDRRGWKEAQR